MVDNLALEWAPDAIRVNAIAPGYTVSDATRPLWSKPKVREGLDASIPLGRLGEADEVAACAVFLAGPGGAYVTGQTIVIDGGLTLRGAGKAKTPDFKAVMSSGPD
jgi:NAD(P)-dependent dehydrogenase (short-subunit alcohol dehydrogenase family)